MRTLGILALSALVFLSACGRGEKQGEPTSPEGAAKAKPAPAVPVVPKTCFDDSRWATPECQAPAANAGSGPKAPQWWGAKRWPTLKYRSSRTLKDVRGRTHWSMDLVRPSELAAPQRCVELMKQSLQGRFKSFESLPSSKKDRVSFRGRDDRYEVTVVCGVSADQQSLVNVDLMLLPSKT